MQHETDPDAPVAAGGVRGGDPVDDLLCRLLCLPPDVAARIRRDVPRRRSRHPQRGPSATFGDDRVG